MTVLPSLRLRTVLVTALFTATTLFVGIIPTDVPIPRPEALTPQPAAALGCAGVPSFEGRLTSSSGSTTPITRTTTGNVFAYISKVVDDWSCTTAYRYDGVAWARDSIPNANWDWGTLINSLSGGCNWAIGSTDYIKANSTTDCPDTDAEYALPIYLEHTLGSHDLLETTFHMTITPHVAGDFMFIHTDCTSYYSSGGGEQVRYNYSFSSAEVNNRPGDNCDPRVVESTNTTQAIVVDHTPPTLAITTPAGASGTVVGTTSTTYGVTFNPSDNVANFGAGHTWSLQRRIAPNTAGGTCGTFVNDTAAGNLVTGTVEGSQTNNQTLVAATCYRWILSGSDMNGNTATALTSATVIVDSTAPAMAFVTAQNGTVDGGPITTVSRNSTSFSVTWTEFDRHSGVNTRSLQRQRVAATSSACPGTFANDGSAVTSASPSAQTLTSGFCYQWIQTLTDKASNSAACTSGRVFVDTTVPQATFSAPVDSPTTYQTGSSIGVTWSEAAGSGTVSSRSLQREKATGSIGICTGLSWAADGSADTNVSPRSSVTAGDGIYRLAETLTNTAAKSGINRSGWVVIDTTAPTGSIIYPETNRALAGNVTITGTASDAATFKEYQLEYGAGASPGSWTSIGTFSSQVISAGPLATWSTGTLNGVYTLRLTVRENASASTYTTSRTVYLENAKRGAESYFTRVPYDLGDGWGLDVGVANGEARLSRDLFSIPSYGPAQALSLSYSSLEPGTTGKFGLGWSSNLTQYLSFEVSGGVTVWHRPDGGRVPFGLIGSTWTPLRGHFETLTVAGAEVTITTKDQTQYIFEASGAGRLLRITNRFGKSLTIAWSTSSATATDASGRVTTVAIDATNGRITGVTDSAGRAWAFGYTGTGTSSLLSTVTDPLSSATTLTYTSALLTGVSRSRTRLVGLPETLTWVIGYTTGKVTAISDPELATPNTITYGATSTTVNTVVDDSLPTYAPRTYTLHEAGLGVVISESAAADADGGIDEVSRSFDADSNLLTETVPSDDPLHDAVTTHTYDARGNVLTQTAPLDATHTVTTVNTYSATNDLLTRTDADNDSATRTVTKSSYDGSGHLASVDRNCTTSGTTIPASGAGGSCTGAGTQDASTNVLTTYAYTANDQLAFEQDPLGRVTKHVYDTYGNETSTIANCTTSGTSAPSPFSSCTAAGTHDAQTNVTTGSTFDAATTAGKAGLATKTTDALGRDTTFTYDALGRQLTEIQPGDASVPALTRTTTWDTVGNSLTEAKSWTPPGGSLQTRTTSHVYHLANREATLTEPSGTQTVTAYWANGSPKQVDELDTGAAVVSSTQYETDLLPRLTRSSRILMTGPVNTNLAYSGGTRAATLTSTTESSGETRSVRTDFAGRTVTEVTAPDPDDPLTGLTTSHTYDVLGHELTSTNEAGVVTTNTYDRLGRLLSTTVGGATTTHAYDRMGNEVTLTDPVGIITTTTYDPLDRATVVVANDVASPTLPTQDVTSTTYYDAAGHQIALKDARGFTTRTIINTQDQPSQTITNCTNSGTTPTSAPASCTGAGTHTDTVNVITNLTYDGQGSVIKTVSAVGRPAETTTETFYDSAGRVQASRDALGTITRNIYDADGRLAQTYVNCTTSGTTILTTGWESCTGAGTADGTYNLHTSRTYDEQGNQATVTEPTGRVSASLYDETGRLDRTIDNYLDGTPGPGTTDDVITTYFYDAYGRQAAIRIPTTDASTTIVNRTVLNDDGTVQKEIGNCTDSGMTAPVEPATCSGAGTADAQTNILTSYIYDSRGNRVRMTRPDPSASSGSSTATVTTQYAFDGSDRLCRVVENATGSTDLQALADPCASATQTTGTSTTNVSTRYTYDGLGNIASMIDAAGHTSTYGYDAMGHSTSRTDAVGEVLVWQYDAVGNQTRQENRSDPPMTASITWTYDAAGRILTRQADSVTTSSTYDLNGNKLTASDGSFTITSTYDRLNRVLTVDDEDAGTTADTTYSYSLTSPTWTDPSGSYAATLDTAGRQTLFNDPANATNFTATYRADGQPATQVQPNGNSTTYGYDLSGHTTSKNTTAAGPTNRALYGWTYNRAGQILTEASTITGDPANGTITYATDPLARLASSTLSGTTATYGWDAVPNRTSVQVGAGTPSTTSFDAANRPTSGANPTATYGSDDDGRLTARPNQTMTWDHLGRLTAVKNAAGTITLATYTYDPLDRLRIVDYGAGVRTRFRYVGTTTSAAQLIDDAAGTVTRNVGNDWTGERLLDWTGTNSNIRIYGTNSHHDVTWLASSTGTVSQSLRYDPWGNPRSTVPTGYSPFRFQGSFYDATTDLAWVVTRWYAPALGTFISEDTLLGDPADPPSRQLYAYGGGDCVDNWDPNGQVALAGDGGPDPCRAIWKSILRLANSVIKRAQELRDDIHNIPWYTRQPGPKWKYGTVEGHKYIFRSNQVGLRNKIADYIDQHCGGPRQRILARKLLNLTKLPAPSPKHRKQPKEPYNWVVPNSNQVAPAPAAAHQPDAGQQILVMTFIIDAWWALKLASPACLVAAPFCAAVL